MTRPADALARPAMPAAPTPAPTVAKLTRRVTLDLPVDDHRRLKLWAVEADLDVSVLLRALVDLAGTDPTIRTRAEDAARTRRGGGS